MSRGGYVDDSRRACPHDARWPGQLALDSARSAVQPPPPTANNCTALHYRSHEIAGNYGEIARRRALRHTQSNYRHHLSRPFSRSSYIRLSSSRAALYLQCLSSQSFLYIAATRSSSGMPYSCRYAICMHLAFNCDSHIENHTRVLNRSCQS